MAKKEQLRVVAIKNPVYTGKTGWANIVVDLIGKEGVLLPDQKCNLGNKGFGSWPIQVGSIFAVYPNDKFPDVHWNVVGFKGGTADSPIILGDYELKESSGGGSYGGGKSAYNGGGNSGGGKSSYERKEDFFEKQFEYNKDKDVVIRTENILTIMAPSIHAHIVAIGKIDDSSAISSIYTAFANAAANIAVSLGNKLGMDYSISAAAPHNTAPPQQMPYSPPAPQQQAYSAPQYNEQNAPWPSQEPAMTPPDDLPF